MRRRLVIVSLVLLLLLVVGVVAVHTPPVKSLALRFAVRAALAQGIQLEAERLDYNLATRRARLSGVKVSAAGDPQPFLTADEVEAAAPPRALLGTFDLDEVALRGAVVRLVRREDGTTNLPKSSGGGTGDPSPLPIARVSASRLDVEYRDEPAGFAFHAPSLTFDVSSRGGRLALDAPATLGFGSTSTSIETFASEAAFDGRDLKLTNLRIESPELRGQVDGTLALLRRQPTMDFRVIGDTGLQEAAKWWGQSSDAPRGGTHFEGTVIGPLARPIADLHLTSNGISWRRLEAGQVEARARLDRDALNVSAARVAFAGGEVDAALDLTWMDQLAQIQASWRDVDAVRLVAAFSDPRLTPSGRTSGDLKANGSFESIESWDADARVRLQGGQRARGRLPAPGDARLRLMSGKWGLEARHVVGGVTPVDVSLTGQLRGAAFADTQVMGTVQASESDLTAIFQMLSDIGVGSVDRDLVTGSLRADATVEGTIARPAVRVAVQSPRVVVSGQPVVDVQARGRLDASTFDLEELTAAQPAEAASSNASGRVRAAGQYDFKADNYTATVSANGWRIGDTPDAPVSGDVSLEYSGEGRGREVFGKARVVSNLTSSRVEIGEVVADVDLQGDHAVIAARAASFNAMADADVRLAAPYAATVKANARALDLARIVGGARLPVLLDGTADVRVEAEGPLQEWRDGRASLEIATLDGHVQALPVGLREPARLRYDGGRVVVERLEGSVGKTVFSAEGALPVSAGSSGDALLATLSGDLYDVASAAAVAADVNRKSTDAPVAAGQGPVVLIARITGSLEAPAYAADLEVGPGTVQARSDLAPVENLRVRAHVENGLIELRDFAGTYQGAMVNATGHAPIALLTNDASNDGDAALHATAVGVTAAVLAPFVDTSTTAQVKGSLDAKLDLTSRSLDLAALAGELVIDRLALTVSDLPVTQRMPTRIEARDGLARITSWSWASEGTSLELSGQVHLSDRQAAIQADGKLDARLLTPFIGVSGLSTGGQVDTRLSITGALNQPTVNGQITLANGELRLRDPRIVANGVNATAVLARGNVFITSMTGSVNGGALKGSGQVEYAPAVRGQFTANITGMAMNFPEGLRTEIDSALEWTTAVNDGKEANRVSGLVTVKRGAYREPLSIATGLLENLKRFGTPTGEPPSPFLQALTLDVRVVTDEDLLIDNNIAKAQLGADLRVINVASAPALSGRAELRQGGRLFLGRNTYEIQNGTIDFANPSTIEPSLGIDATTRVAGIDIDVRITGTPDNVMTELTSSSDPELGQSDLTALLLTGQKMAQLGERQAALVGAQVLGNDALGLAGRAVGLDTLRVEAETNPRDLADLASEADPTSRVTFGKSFGSKVDVTLSQSLVETNEQTWILDYLPVRRIALRFVQDDQELRSYEFRHDLTFGYAPNAIRSGDVSREVKRPRVSSVRFAGDLRVPEARVRGVLRLTEGDRFDFIEWQDDRDRLERFYQEQQHWAVRLTADREESPDGVALTYTIQAGPETRVRVSGMSLPGSAVDEIKAAWTQSVFEGFLIEEAETIVRRELARQATYQPSLEITVEGDDAVRTLVVDVVPSPRARRISVEFSGVDERLKAKLRDQAGRGEQTRLALTDPAAYERLLLSVLRANGYAQATVSVGMPVFEEDLATVPVTVDPGPEFRLGTVTFEGATGVALDDLRGEAGLEEGALYRAADVENARMRLQTRYRRESFTTAMVESRETVRAADARVDVVFTVQEGPRQVIQEITIDGLQEVQEDVARRTLRLKIGDNLRTSDWIDARRRLFESGLFRRVDVAVEPLPGLTETTPVRIRVVVEEWPALRVRYGLQVAEERPEENVKGRDLVPGISGDVTRRTLFGRAITVGVAAQYESLERLGRVFMNTPTMFGQPIQSSLTLERSREESHADTLVTNRTTAAWEQRGRFAKLTLSYGLRFERNRTFDTQPLDPDFPLDLTAHIGRLTTSATWDTRDDASDSTRGAFVSTSLEHGSSRLGSDLLFLRSLTQAYYFRPWKSMVLASAARYGAAMPLAGQVLAPSLRFLAGGARTVRGVPEDSLGGLDFSGNPIGGRGLLTLNQELRFPIYRWLRGVTFIDTGNVFPEGSAVRVTELVGSTGVGLRLVTPFALFRVDYGRTIWNRPVKDSGLWVFGIGQTF